MRHFRSESLVLDVIDKDVMTLPPPMIGIITRIGARNPTNTDIDITLQDRFTPDPSALVPSPTMVTENKYSFRVPTGENINIDGKVIAKIKNNFRIHSSATGVVFSYTMEIL